MEWLVLGALVLVGASIIKWLTEKNSKKTEAKTAHNHEKNKLRLEPSAHLPETHTPAFTYQAKPLILSPAEQKFYTALSQGLNNQFIILMKVRVADVLQPQAGISKSK